MSLTPLASAQASQAWAPVNPCDHDISHPYYIGDLVIAAANCTRSCPTSTYPDKAQVCHACQVVGCATCSQEECQDCLIFHLRVSGQCFFLFGAVFAAVVLFVLCFFLLASLRFVCLSCTTPRNPAVLREAIAHRRRAKVHDYSLPGNPFYAYDDTDVRGLSISGLGPALYFNFVGMSVLLCFLFVAGLGSARLLSVSVPPRYLAQATAGHAAAVYGICVLAVLRWISSQASLTKRDVEDEPHLRNYALVAEGLPKAARSPHEVKAFFESILGFEIEGVSIAYDYTEELEFVEDRIARTLERADTNLGVYPSELAGVEGHSGSCQDGHVLDCLMCSGVAFVVFSREEDRDFCQRRFAEIERQVDQAMRKGQWGAGGTGGNDTEDDEETSLLPTEPGRRKGTGGGPSRAVLFRGKYPVRVGVAPEPCGIQWYNFTVQGSTRAVRMVFTFFLALLVVFVMGSVMLAPAILYRMSYQDIRKPTGTQWQLAVLEQGVAAATVAIGNRLLQALLRRAAVRSGFRQRVGEDVALCVCAFCATLLNSSTPLCVAATVAASERTTATKDLAASWLFQVLWMCMLAAEVAGILSPLWNYCTAHFWVRQSKHASVREAEPIITSPEFPIATRYADVLQLLCLLCLLIALDSASLYTLGAACVMLVYSIYVYFIDKYMFLRINRQTTYVSPNLDNLAQTLLVFPFSALFLLPLQRVFIRSQPWMNLLVVAVNALLFLCFSTLCRRCQRPQRERSDISYVEVASLSPCNYFNTNPVHVLRSLHFPSIVVPPIYPYAPGKEYLQGGQFADYDDTVRLRETLMLLAKNPLKGVADIGNPQDFG